MGNADNLSIRNAIILIKFLSFLNVNLVMPFYLLFPGTLTQDFQRSLILIFLQSYASIPNHFHKWDFSHSVQKAVCRGDVSGPRHDTGRV